MEYAGRRVIVHDPLTAMNDNSGRAPSHIEVTDKDLPLHCPTPAMMLWAAHPRVFLDIERTGEAMCPYCGTRFTYKGEGARGGH
jgi:uncharacterized Zn-finger protein